MIKLSCHVSDITHHVSDITYHVSDLSHHVSDITHHVSYLLLLRLTDSTDAPRFLKAVPSTSSSAQWLKSTDFKEPNGGNW